MTFRNLLMKKRNSRLPLEYPFLDSLKIYASRLLVISLIYGICLSIFLIFTGQIVEFGDTLIACIIAINVSISGFHILLRIRSKSADDEIDD
jgi:flagellar biosynthesis protein FliQ